jgi:glycosyltransferase involved in cell wall biosynthesis
LAALDHLENLPVVADVCDSTWVRLRSRLPHLNVRWWPQALAYHWHASGIERQLLRRSAHALVAAPRDLRALGARAAAKTSVVPNGVDLEFWKRRSPMRGTDTIVFTGAMHYRPNVDAALYLIGRILPAVRQSVPEARLLIVGRDPTPALLAARDQPGVLVTGFVEDMRPYLEQGSVFAAALRFGAGIQNKVLEAMAMELPIVASPIAADGLRTQAGDAPPIEVARSQREFVRHIVSELRAARRDAIPCRATRRYVEQHFPWSTSGDRLEHVLDRVTREHRPAPQTLPAPPSLAPLARRSGAIDPRP